MQNLALVLVGLACIGNALPADIASDEWQSNGLEDLETPSPSQNLAMLLLGSRPATGFNPAVPMASPMVSPMVNLQVAPIRSPAPVMISHGIRKKKLGRKGSARKALLRGLTTEVIRHGRIRTTLVRCKILRKHVDKMIALAKEGSVRSRRNAISFLYDKQLVYALFDQAGERYSDRNGGYSRVLKDGFRRGDNAEMGIIELV